MRNKNLIIELLKTHLGNYVNNGTEEFYFRCPFCTGEKTGDTRYVFGFNINKNVYGCHRCGEGGSLKDLAKKLSIDLRSYTRPQTERKSHEIASLKAEKIELSDYVSFKGPSRGGKKHTGFDRTYEYAKRRGFIKVECGYSTDHPYYVIFPIYDKDKNLIFYQGRSVIPGQNKTVNPKIPKPGILYSPYGYNDILILVEGIADAIAVRGHSLLGSRPTKLQIKFIGRLVAGGQIKEIVLWLDGEYAAILKMIEVYELFCYKFASLGVHTSVIDWRGIPNYTEKDPDAISNSERVFLYKNRISHPIKIQEYKEEIQHEKKVNI